MVGVDDLSLQDNKSRRRLQTYGELADQQNVCQNISSKAKILAGDQILGKMFSKIFYHETTGKKIFPKDNVFSKDCASINMGVKRC